MRHCQISGTIQKIEFKEGVQRKNGNGTFDICSVTISCRDSVRQPDGQWKRQNIMYVETAAFGQLAQTWAKRFSKGDAVEISGKFTPEAYINQRTGQPGVRITVEGYYGGAPDLDKAPAPFANDDQSNNQNDDEIF